MSTVRTGAGWRLARVAGIAAGGVIVLYALLMTVIDFNVFQSLITDADSHVLARLSAVQYDRRALLQPIPGDSSTPSFFWLYDNSGSVTATSPGAPAAPTGLHPIRPEWLQSDGHHFRVASISAYDPSGQPAGWLMLGRSVDDVYGSMYRLIAVEIGFAIPLALVAFLGSLWIARRSVAPVEDARRRQLAFTADASHELRTPLTVIEAEASLALQKERDADSYRESIVRIASEGARLRRIVEDLLWLARFESEPDRPAAIQVDLGEVANDSVARFQHVADGRGIKLTGEVLAGAPPIITAPPDWVDRLAGVLVDNACRYTPDGGTVSVSVVTGDGRTRLAVDDSGPGIPPDDRARIFDRFHRATNTPGGAGLGLAIGNAIVSATGGRWEIGESPAGGARVAVNWPLARPAEPQPAPVQQALPEHVAEPSPQGLGEPTT